MSPAPNAPRSPAVRPRLPEAMDIRKALSTPPPIPDFVLPGLSAGTVGAVIAPGATGKTLLLLQICAALAAGAPVFGQGLFGLPVASPAPAKVVLVVAEETASVMHARLHAAVAEMLTRLQVDLFSKGEPLEDLFDRNLRVIPLAGRARMTLDGTDPLRDGLDDLRELSVGARLVVLDPLRQFHSGDENDPWVMTKLVQDLQVVACEMQAAVLLAHHTNKWSTTAGQGELAGASRGSGAFTDAVRWQMNLSALDDKLASSYGIGERDVRQHVRVDLAKSNYLPPQAPLILRRGPGGAFSAVSAPGSSNPSAGKRRGRST